MIASELSGVIACRSISTTRPEAAPRKSVPFKAWPEIEDWLIYHALPTVNILYRPDVVLSLTDVEFFTLPPGYSVKEQLNELLRLFPNREEFMARLMSQFQEYVNTLGEHIEALYGIENAQQGVNEYIANVLASLGELESTYQPGYPPDTKRSISSITEALTKMSSPEDTFSQYHENGHFYSFALTRPAIIKFKATWSAIEDLLQQAAIGGHEGFWDKFNDFNSKLKDCLSNSLVLEELRANLFALDKLPLDMQTTFINKVYGEESKNGINKESEVFYTLQFLTGGRLMIALFLTILAECLDPSDPESQLEQVQNSLKVESAHTWSDEQWISWFQQWYRMDTWENIFSINEYLRENSYTILPSGILSGRPNGNISAACTETTRLSMFHESMRQQLFYKERVRTLTCPFKGRHRSCCGFGHFLRNLWAAIPDEDKRRLKPPSQACMKYSP